MLNEPSDNLLLKEIPLVILPKLAVRIGLNEAVMLQQIHFRSKDERNIRDGRSWCYDSYEGWNKMFPFFSVSTLRRTLSNLEKWNLIIVGNHNKMKSDQTKWYTVNYDKVREIDDNPELLVKPKRKKREAKSIPAVENDSPCVQVEQATCSKWTGHVTNLNKPLPKTPTKTPSNTLERVETEPIKKISEQMEVLGRLMVIVNEEHAKVKGIRLYTGDGTSHARNYVWDIFKEQCNSCEPLFRMFMGEVFVRWDTLPKVKALKRWAKKKGETITMDLQTVHQYMQPLFDNIGFAKAIAEGQAERGIRSKSAPPEDHVEAF